ncbi:hypothetical protein [Sporosarcina psychrophila]|uniref:hypothetical protein n=1 Tax=Sporosarcina psychrophila TaxID=1476 RepID=UPI00078E1F32|nr:hypothetical protein [Sporosarcina psychrophila]AMQ06776.1 hypothetical protein AZE41_12990 [Sporosarcina psychrophila]
MDNIKIELNFIHINLLLVEKHLNNNDVELATNRLQAALKILEELQDTKKPTDTGMSIGGI